MNYQIGSEEIRHFTTGALVKHFLLASYCYFHLKESTMTGGGYETAIERIKKEFNFISRDNRYYLADFDNLNKKLPTYPDHFNLEMARKYVDEVYSGKVAEQYAIEFSPVIVTQTISKISKSLTDIATS